MIVNIPIFLSSDDNYAPFVATTIASICDNTNSLISFHVLDSGISKENKNKIKKLNNKYSNFSINYYEVNLEKSFENFNATQYLSLSTYSRFLIPNICNLDKVIYLDVDIIVPTDIQLLYSENLNDYAIGAIKDQGSQSYINKTKKNIDMNYASPYFNAGVLLMSCDKWRKDKILPQLFDIERKYHDVLLNNDQDILNKYFENNYKLLDTKYNAMYPRAEVVIRHFAGIIKPWQLIPDLCVDNFSDYKIFWKYAKETPFYDELIQKCKYKSPIQLKLLKVLQK